jgi:predicted O-linked N-acetylglucosamine transferase (SPINDLY family)
MGLPAEGIVFCSFNNPFKIEPEIFDVWMRILRRVPGSVLWLLTAHREVERNLRREAERRAVEPERLIFAPVAAKDFHLARHRLADLFLDTVSYNAHTTAVDALWAGLPIVTCPGQTFVTRVAASLLRAVNLPDLVVDSLAGYEETAVSLAMEPGRLADLKARLQVNLTTAPLFRSAARARHLEAAYLAMWGRFAAGLEPGPIDLRGTAAPV